MVRSDWCRLAAWPLGLLWLAFTPAYALNYFVDVGGTSGQVVYTPQTVTIAAGDSITWRNLGGRHNVLANNGSFRCARGCDGDGHGGDGTPNTTMWIVTVPMNTPGTIGYYCEVHGSPGSGMFGTIIVNETIFANGFQAP